MRAALKPGLNIVWFKRDLRIADHEPLALAASHGPVLPLYIAEPGLWAQPDAAARHWAFAAACLSELQDSLAAIGQKLYIIQGEAVAVLAHLHTTHGIAAIFSHEETGNGWTYARDRAVAAWAKAAGIPWHEKPQFGVIRRLKSRNGWATAWDRQMATPVTPAPQHLTPVADIAPGHIPSPAALGLAPDPCPHRQPGGRAVALALLESFLTERGEHYRTQMSSPVTAFTASSRLSAHLTWGTISMRELSQASAARLRALQQSTHPAARTWRGAIASFIARQHWHCHFIQKLEDEPRLEFENLHPAYNGMRPDTAAPDRLEAWSRGQTGFPFLDACMRALNQHGWINFRMRAMLTSFASYHLWLPWRATGLHLARQFVDYEPGIHWPQIQMQSGTTGINTMRIYNPVKQGYDQDPLGSFVRAYVPELRDLPGAFIHEPWRWPHAASLAYPAPIIDHEATGKTARQRLHAIRQNAAHAPTSRLIAAKHGSRKAGIPATGKKPPTRAKPKPTAQLVLDF
ncbi:MAG: FAD-binding domain-containing protein [Acidocella sp.]|nr:FAD-binding domain-containing protein [Acidocella sp.]